LNSEGEGAVPRPPKKEEEEMINRLESLEALRKIGFKVEDCGVHSYRVYFILKRNGSSISSIYEWIELQLSPDKEGMEEMEVHYIKEKEIGSSSITLEDKYFDSTTDLVNYLLKLSLVS